MARRSARYVNYMRSATWASRKRAYYARHGRRCRACGTTRNIELHHLSYRHLCHEPDRDLMALCKRHHDWTGWAHGAGFSNRTAAYMVVIATRVFGRQFRGAAASRSA